MKQYAVRPIKGATLLDHLLFYRGIESPAEVEKFINPDYDNHTHDPFLMKDMEKAVSRTLRAIKDNEKVLIYSDYDTDGIPGAVALHDFFKKIGFNNFTNYIPHRHDEGFGLNSEAIKEFIKDGVKLLITIDCGIGNAEETKEAREGGIDVIITDHHLVGEKIPEAFATLNPKQAECNYPEKMLCGAGVVFKLIQALVSRLKTYQLTNFSTSKLTSGWEKWLLDMVGIATLSDMVPLLGENRIFAHYGLMVLRKSPRIGIIKLLSKLKIAQRHLTEDDIGFTIGPRINAASRMGLPMDAFRLLATEDEVEADLYADHLNKINDERKGVVAVLAKEIKKTVRNRYSDSKITRRVMVIGNPLWKPALLGLVANSCVKEYNCPVFLWGRDGDNVIKGSCRSAGEVNLLSLMQASANGTFLEFGGHAFSGGFSVHNEKIHMLEESLNRAYEAAGAAPAAEENFVDKELSLKDADWNTYKTIEKLSPFGTGNPKPLFLFRNVVPHDVRHFGKEKNHLELIFEKPDGKKLSALAFFKTANDWGRELKTGEPINLVATFEKSMFRNFPELRLRIVDIY